MIGKAYQLGNLSIMIIDRIRDSYIVALQKVSSKTGNVAQFPFVPIHKGIVEEFVQSAEFIGDGVPSSIDGSLKLWEQYRSAYFTIRPEEIWDIGVSLLSKEKELKEFAVGENFLFPPIFPAHIDDLDGLEGISGIMDRAIGEKSSPHSN